MTAALNLNRVLMGPGPSDVDPRVLAALARPTVGHLDPAFLSIMNDVGRLLRQTFRTQNQLTFAVSGTGSAGMEACVANLIEPGDSMLVCVNGLFGTRMVDVAQRCGAHVIPLEIEWGRVFDPQQIADALRQHSVKVVGIVHAETSTGAHQPLEDISRLVHEAGALLVVDAVTSLAGAPLEVDAWKIDACYSGTQKCLSCPPGLSPVTFGPAALDVIDRRKTKVQSWYLDATMLRSYWGTERVYHHTAPINMNYALLEALQMVDEEGLEQRWQRHRVHHQVLKAGLTAIGIQYVTQEGHQLPMLNAIAIPDGIDDLTVRKQMLREFGVEIGGGLGKFKGKAWRIGLMGATCHMQNVMTCLSALETALATQGYQSTRGASVAAAIDKANELGLSAAAT